MGVANEQPTGRPNLAVTREPVGPKTAGDKGSPGDVALMDAITLIVISWAIIFLLLFSVRSHNL